MGSKYIVRIKNNTVYEISSPNKNILVYKFPYADLKNNKIDIKDLNDFVCYILFGRNANGKDYIYVGKSTNGLKNRQLSHEDKYDGWEICYLLTNYKDNSYFNDGTIQYIEDKLRKIIDENGSFNNTTKQTSQNAIGLLDEEDCDDYVVEACKMLNAFGLDLLSNFNDSEDKEEDEEISQKETSDSQKESYIGKKIYKFGYKGKPYYPASPRDMLDKMMTLLYKENPEKISELAKKDYKIPGAFQNRGACFLSNDTNKFISQYGNMCEHSKIDGTNIYYLTNHNNNRLVNFIKSLVNECGLKEDDFFVEFENKD